MISKLRWQFSQSGTYGAGGGGGGGTPITTIEGNDSVKVGPDGTGNINLLTANANIGFINTAANTETLSFAGDANYNLILGPATATVPSTYSGQSNFGFGLNALYSLSSGNQNAGVGQAALANITSGSNNTAVGNGAAANFVTDSGNTAFGNYALTGFGSGSNNTAIGNLAGSNGILFPYSGSYNTLVGYSSGTHFLTTEANNIMINSFGVAADNNTLRIGDSAHISSGTPLTATYIGGINGVDLNTVNVVTESGDRLGTAMITAGANVTVTKAANQIIISASGGGGGTSINITGDTGGTLTSTAFTFTGGTTGLTFNGAGSTETLDGTLHVANGGTGDVTFTAYAPVCGGTTSTGALQSATTGFTNSGYILTSNGASALPSWQAAPSGNISITGDSGGALVSNAFTFTGGTTGLTFAGAGTTETLGGTLIVANGGTGRTTLTNHGLLVGAGTAAITQLADATNGQLPIGSTGADPVLATITAGAGVSVTNGAGSITIASTGGGFTWHDVTSGSATLAASNGYIADLGSLTTFTLPTNNTYGDTIKIVGKGSGGWKIVYGAGQSIIYGVLTSTTTTGNIASTNQNDCVELICTTASASAPIFTVVNGVGNITIV